MKDKRLKETKEKGITLLALVVTIILLLILSGVTISQITGENGLFKRFKHAVGTFENAQMQEELAILEFEKYITDFSITGGDDSVALNITKLEVKVTDNNISVVVEIDGNATKVEYSKDNGKTWQKNEEDITSKEYLYENVDPGSYFIRVRAYDEESRYQEATSDVVTVTPTTTAKNPDVLSGKTYLTGEGVLETGTMTNQGKKTETLDAGETYTIPEGYHDGTGTVTAKTFAAQTPGTAVPEHIVEDETAWVNGKQITGTMKYFWGGVRYYFKRR